MQSIRAVFVVVVVLALAALGVAGCGGSSSSTTSSSSGGNSSGGETGGEVKNGGEITIAVPASPISLDPAIDNNTVDQIGLLDLAYEPLIVLDPDGSLSPGLAKSWRYTDSSLESFELTLRPGVKFSDGEPLTAEAVVASLEHVMKANGPTAVYIEQIKSAKAVGPMKVQLQLVRPNPEIAFLLTNRFNIGRIISPKAAANPKALGTTTDGVGPYVLDSSQTTAGSTYVFKPNPNYYDQSAIHFDTFTVKVIENPQTALNALQSGQVAYAEGGIATASPAEAAGLAVYSVPYGWYGITLLDREGDLVPALAEEKVRQALNYAIDNEGITNALLGEFGAPNDEISIPGYEKEGFDPSYINHYSYDPEKAKELLSEAGFPDGFSVTIGASPDFAHGVELAQAVANDWEAIGVKTKVQTYPGLTQLVAAWSAKKLPATAGDYGAQPMFIQAGQMLEKGSGLYNIFENVEPKMEALIAKAYATTNKAAVAEAWQAVQRQVVDSGWEVPVATEDKIYLADPELKGVEASPKAFAPNPTLWHY